MSPPSEWGLLLRLGPRIPLNRPLTVGQSFCIETKKAGCMLWEGSESLTHTPFHFPHLQSCTALGVQSGEGGWCEVRQGLGTPWAAHSQDSSCPLQVPEGCSLSGRRKLTSCRQHPTGLLGQSQRPDPQPSLRTMTPTLGEPLPTAWL